MHDDAILRDAHAAPPKGGLVQHRQTIQVLRDKGYSWREISQFLAERGVATDHTAIYRFFTRTRPSMSTTTAPVPTVTVPSAAEYALALETLESRGKITPAQRDMLAKHYRAPNRTVTYTELAEEAGFAGAHQGANLQYGFLAKAVGNELGFTFAPSERRPGQLFHGSALGMMNQWPQGHDFELVMHHELAKALDSLGWFR